MTGAKVTDICLGCGKKLKKSETSVQCIKCASGAILQRIPEIPRGAKKEY
jgi:hypothetical protein